MPTPLYRGWLTLVGTRESASPTRPPVEKPSPYSRVSDPFPSTVVLYNTRRAREPSQSRHTRSGAQREGRPARPTAGREAAGEPARPAAQRPLGASSPERAPSANRRAHRLDQPEAAPCGPTRKADRQDRPEGGPATLLSRCGLHLTFVRTTKETLTRRILGVPRKRAGEVRPASASWERAAGSHPTEPARWAQ